MRVISLTLATIVSFSTAGVGQDTPDIRGWRTAASIGFANVGGDYGVGPGVTLGAAFNFVPTTSALGFGFGYHASIHSVDGDQFILHQLNASPRVTRISGGKWYQYVGVDALISVWDFNFASGNIQTTTLNAQGSGIGIAPSAGIGGLTFGQIGFDVSVAYSLLWFANPRDPNLTIISGGGGGRAQVLRITVGGWFKGDR